MTESSAADSGEDGAPEESTPSPSESPEEVLGTEFEEMIDLLLLGYSNIDVQSILSHIDFENMDYPEIIGLLAHIGDLAGVEGMRVAMIHILIARGDLDTELLGKFVDDSDYLDGIDLC